MKMKKISLAKIASLIFVCVMLFVALAIGVYADETTESIVPKDVFTFKGYSMDEDGNACFGFTLNPSAKEEYEYQLGTTVDIGLVIAIYEDGNTPLDAEGNPTGKVYKKSLNDIQNTSYSYKLVNFESLGSTKYVITPYVSNGTNVYYYENGEVSETVGGVSYDEIVLATHECVDKDGDYKCDFACGEFILPEADSFLTLEQANKIAALQEHDTYTEGKYYVTGVITEIVSATYGNVYIEDENGNTFYIYGIYTIDGETRYDAMTDKPVVGDEITVLGIIGRYNDFLQMKNGWLDEVVKHECEYSEATCETLATCSICGGTTGELAAHNYADGKCSVCGSFEGVSTTDKSYVFADYDAGVQFADNEEHVLDDNTVMYTTDAHFTTQLRLYSSTTYNAYAIIESINGITKIAVNAGNAADTLVVYGSNDEGATWTEAARITVTSSYKDYEADLGGSYKWLKLDVDGTNQVRIASMTLTTMSCTHLNTTTTTTPATCTEKGSEVVTCNACNEVVSEKEIEALGHDFVDNICSVCGAEEHEHDYEAVVTNPTCTEAGYTTYTCKVEGCENSYTEAGDPALGHAYAEGICANCGGTDPDYYFPMTITEALQQEDGKQVEVTGTVIKINTAYSESYNNITVTIADGSGDTLYIYRLTGNFALNNIITVSGTMATYNGAKQIGQGATATVDGTHTCSEYTEATCLELAGCVVCGATIGELASHNYVDGTCSVCGGTEGSTVNIAVETFEIAANAGTLSDDSLSISWASNNFNFDGEKAESSTAIRTSDSDHYRIYQSSKFTVSANNGQKIKTMDVTCTSSSYATVLVTSLTNAGFTATADGKTVTVEANGVESISFTASAQIRVASFEIKYEA